MRKISETEFTRICEEIAKDRETIIRHNPIGSDEEILLWMLLSCLNSYLSLDETEVPCFAGVPDEEAYRDAITFVLRCKAEGNFDPRAQIDKLVNR